MKKFLSFLSASLIAVSAFAGISGGLPASSGGGVGNGQQLRDDNGNLFLDAGEHAITSANWSINADGSASFANIVDIGGSASDPIHFLLDGGLRSGNDEHSAWDLYPDGSASFAQGRVLVDSNGNLQGSSGAAPSMTDWGTILGLDDSYFISAGDGHAEFGFGAASINGDGSASFAQGGVTIIPSSFPGAGMNIFGALISDTGDILGNSVWSNWGNGVGLLTMGIDFEWGTAVDTNIYPASDYPYTIIKGTDGKPYWSDGTDWHTFY